MNMTKEYVLAGKAVLTVEIPESFREEQQAKGIEVKPHYTYRVKFKKGNDRYKDVYFLQLLAGPDNTKNYTYLGILSPKTGDVYTSAKSCHTDDHMSVRLARRVFSRIWLNDVSKIEHHGFKLHHEGHCGRCGRALTVPESVESGIGPECAKYMGLKVAHVKPQCDERDDESDNEPDYAREAEDRALAQAEFLSHATGPVGPYPEGY
jgi:hypothetical protein